MFLFKWWQGYEEEKAAEEPTDPQERTNTCGPKTCGDQLLKEIKTNRKFMRQRLVSDQGFDSPLTTQIKQLLDKADQTRGKEAKIPIVEEIFDLFITDQGRNMLRHPRDSSKRLVATVFMKIFEMIQDGMPVEKLERHYAILFPKAPALHSLLEKQPNHHTTIFTRRFLGIDDDE